MNKVYILGAGAQAREVWQIYKDLDKEKMIGGFIISNKGNNKKLRGVGVYDETLINKLSKNDKLICAVGNPFLRRDWVLKISTTYNSKYTNAIHPTVIISNNVIINDGTIIQANSIISCDIEIGKHVLINLGCSLSHDNIIGNFCTLSPGVTLGGRVVIGEGSFIGLGTNIIHNVKIGSGCIIGAGSLVIKDVPDNMMVYGIPAKPIRQVTDQDWENLL